MSAKPKKVKKPISSAAFEKLVDEGADLSEHLDVGRAVWKVNVDFPTWMVKALDKEADRLSVPRQALIKMWIDEKLKEADIKKAT